MAVSIDWVDRRADGWIHQGSLNTTRSFDSIWPYTIHSWAPHCQHVEAGSTRLGSGADTCKGQSLHQNLTGYGFAKCLVLKTTPFVFSLHTKMHKCCPSYVAALPAQHRSMHSHPWEHHKLKTYWPLSPFDQVQYLKTIQIKTWPCKPFAVWILCQSATLSYATSNAVYTCLEGRARRRASGRRQAS